MIEFYIKENDANQRVDRFLTKSLKNPPKSLLYKWIRNKKIKVNRKRCEISQRLNVGDIVQCFIAEEFRKDKVAYDFLKVPYHLDILYEDDNILIANKPIGVLSQKSKAGIEDTMQDRLLHYLYMNRQYQPEFENSFTPSFIHRLDRNTEGLMIAGKNKEALQILNEKMKEHEIEKYYVCIVEGHLSKRKGEICLSYQKDNYKNKAKVSSDWDKQRPQIHTLYQVLDQFALYSYVEVQLKTGKSHQIRASFAHIHHPLVGDIKYGGKAIAQLNSQCLCAYKVKFNFKSDAKLLTYLNQKEFFRKNNFVEILYKQLKNNK